MLDKRGFIIFFFVYLAIAYVHYTTQDTIMQDFSFQNTHGRYVCGRFLEMSRKPFSKQYALFVTFYLLNVIRI